MPKTVRSVCEPKKPGGAREEKSGREKQGTARGGAAKGLAGGEKPPDKRRRSFSNMPLILKW